ncbi:HIT family protein [Streptomyces vinaceus]|uniref:HIT family protein n=1 Tax=Streptomyces vinaceus TaxID=1960 RepID=UPI0036BA6E3E
MDLKGASQLADCPFCEIASGRASAARVYESNDVVAFLPLAPATTGHTLVIPKKHIRDLWQMDEKSMTSVMNATILISRAIRDAFNPDGMNLINSTGAAATQTVSHFHVHLVPRWEEDQMGDLWPDTEPWNQKEMTAAAGSISRAIDELVDRDQTVNHSCRTPRASDDAASEPAAQASAPVDERS